MIGWILLVPAPFVIGVLLAGGTVLEGIALFFGLSVALALFKGIFGAIMQAREDRKFERNFTLDDRDV